MRSRRAVLNGAFCRGQDRGVEVAGSDGAGAGEEVRLVEAWRTRGPRQLQGAEERRPDCAVQVSGRAPAALPPAHASVPQEAAVGLHHLHRRTGRRRTLQQGYADERRLQGGPQESQLRLFHFPRYRPAAGGRPESVHVSPGTAQTYERRRRHLQIQVGGAEGVLSVLNRCFLFFSHRSHFFPLISFSFLRLSLCFF
jgi:hypothetical protein